MSIFKQSFTFDIQNISKLKDYYNLPTVYIQKIPWQLKIVKLFNETKLSLGIYLHCVKENVFLSSLLGQWSYVASASFKLESHQQNVEAVKFHLLPTVFDNNDSTFGTPTFIDWDDLMDASKGYVSSDAIKLKMKIEVVIPKDRNNRRSELIFKKSEKTESFSKFNVTIKNIKHLTAVKSPTFEIKDTKFNLIVCKYEDHLAMSLYESDNTEISMLVKLFSTKGEEKSDLQFVAGRMEKFIPWIELLEPANSFINNKCIRLEFTFMENSAIQNAKSFLQTMTPNVSVPRFFIEISNISELQERICLPEVMIRGVPWMIRVLKVLDDGKQYLVFTLHCLKQNTSFNWSYVASFSIKLLSFNENTEAIERHYLPCVYNYKNGYGGGLILLNDLFDASKCYVKNDMITLDVQIDVADPYDSNKSELIFKDISNGSETDGHKYQLTVKNIRSLMAVKSPQFMTENLQWYLTVYKHNNQFGVSLAMYGKKSCTRQMLVRILSSKKEHSVEEIKSKYFQPGSALYTVNLTWEELLNPENGFINDNSITVEVEITSPIQNDILFRDFHQPTAPQPSETDCVICFESMLGKNVASTACGHVFCPPCIEKSLKDLPNCPVCRKPAKLEDLHHIFLPF